MGACGCVTDWDIIKVIEIRDCLVILSLYHGCGYCKTSPSIDVMTYEKQEIRELFGDFYYYQELVPLIEERFDDNYTLPIEIDSLLDKLEIPEDA